ncbi:hypothetical protein [Nocardiopsis alba]|uniref:hypothetical protein n=1 Tax=Nocardiopsis alba TaxID=53437 RepID=UPI003D749B5B
MNSESAEADLREYAAITDDRDNRVINAYTAGITKNRIHTITGISRVTIDKILKEHAMKTATTNLIWSIVRGESPESRAVEPGVAGIEIPAEVVNWAEERGLNENAPDVYLLVTPEDEAGEVQGEIAYTPHPASNDEVALVWAALLEQED